MFLNYMLDENLLPWVGVDVSELGTGTGSFVVERWERTLMGLRPSHFVCTQSFGWSEDVIRGDRHDASNPLAWDKVILNLPGNSDYDPTRP